MGIQKIENVKIVCDWCEEEITKEELDEVKDALNPPIAYFMDQVSHARLKFDYLCIPYGKAVEKPIFCKKCAAKILASALYRVTHFQIDAERAAKAFAKGTLVKASMDVEEKEAAK